VAKRLQRYMAEADERQRVAELAAAEAQVKIAAARRARVLTVALAGAVVLAVFAGGAYFRSQTLGRVERAAELGRRVDANVSQVHSLQSAGRLEEALVIARNNESFVADSDSATNEQLGRAARLVGEVTAAITERDRVAARDARNARILAELEELQLDSFNFILRRDIGGLAQLYEEFFAKYDLKIDFSQPNETVEALRTTGIATEIASALDGWSTSLRESNDTLGKSHSLIALAMDLDSDPGRTEVRNAIYGDDVDRMLQILRAARERGTSARMQYTLLTNLIVMEAQFPGGVYNLTASMFPDDFLMNAMAGSGFAYDQRFERAVGFLQTASALRPQNRRIRTDWCRTLSKVGEKDFALRQMTPLLADSENYNELTLGVALLWDLGDFSGALQFARRNLAVVRNEQGRFGDELNAYTEVLCMEYLAGEIERAELMAFGAKYEEDSDVQLNVMIALADHPDATTADYEEVVRLGQIRLGSAQHELRSRALCEALVSLGRSQEVLREADTWEGYTQFVDQHGAAIRESQRARAYAQLGQMDLARDHLELANQLASNLTDGDERAWADSIMMRLLLRGRAEVRF